MIMDSSTKETTRSSLFWVFITTILVTVSNSIISVHCDGGFGESNGCFESERQALLKLKKSLQDPQKQLASWLGEDCCQWNGVFCNTTTGHVYKLTLRGSSDGWPPQLSGVINPSLLDLKHLTHLDLSQNNFMGTQIPKFFGSIGSLTHLNLSDAGFEGVIPSELGNLTKLVYLDLGSDDFSLQSKNLLWLSRLSSLKYLDLRWTNLSEAHDWLEVTNALPSLVELRFSYCYLGYTTLGYVNFTSLSHLDLSSNFFTEFPSCIFKLRKLSYLDLSNNWISGPFSEGIQNLTSLKYLDLSGLPLNSSIPSSLYKLSRLEVLNFQGCPLGSVISSEIKNLTSITKLDLSFNKLEGKLPSSMGELCNLRKLDLSMNELNQNISQVVTFFSRCVPNNLEMLDFTNNHFFGHLTNEIGLFESLTELVLGANSISGPIPPSMAKLGKLRKFDLSANKLSQQISQVLESLNGESLENLNLMDNQLYGLLTNQIGQFGRLTDLYLSYNSISGPIPSSLANLSSLRSLLLNNNLFNETLPESFGQLSLLEYVDIWRNNLKGILSETHFANMTSLRSLRASQNALSLSVSRDWTPRFQLDYLDLSSWRLGSEFPMWLQSQKNLGHLDLSNASLSCPIPSWFGNFSSHLQYVDLSHNLMHGRLPNMLESEEEESKFDLSYNQFEGPLTLISPKVVILDLSNNLFSGSTSEFLCHNMSDVMSLQLLDLGDNRLSGQLPDCWNKWHVLTTLTLSHNMFTGTIPSSMGSLSSLESLRLYGNKLMGKLPFFIQNFSELVILDLGDNNFRGKIPSWIGRKLVKLEILIIRSNELVGSIPEELCDLNFLRILDLALNRFSGPIPKCFNKFNAMATPTSTAYGSYSFPIVPMTDGEEQKLEDIPIMMKGKMVEYETTLRFVISIDLSSNFLSGIIPEEITSLSSLLSLNLSKNLLTGIIPAKIGDMRALESIDFSENRLSGEIPPAMTSLSFLSHLNLSHNNLSGMIPQGTQLQSFNASSFGENHLCGPPLTKKCVGIEGALNPPRVDNLEKIDWLERDWLYVSIALGFIVGFWGVSGALILKRSWRFVYFRFLDDMWYKFCDAFLKHCF